MWFKYKKFIKYSNHLKLLIFKQVEKCLIVLLSLPVFFLDLLFDLISHLFDHLEDSFFSLFSLPPLLLDGFDTNANLLVDLAEYRLIALRPLLGFDGDQILETRHVILERRLKLLYRLVTVAGLLRQSLAHTQKLVFDLLEETGFHLLPGKLLSS